MQLSMAPYYEEPLNERPDIPAFLVKESATDRKACRSETYTEDGIWFLAE